MNLKGLDWERLPPIAGGQVDPDAGGGEPASGGAQAPAPAGGEEPVTIDGETYTVDELREALDSHATRSQWQATHTQRDQREANVRRVLEAAFGKPIQELDDKDLADLQGFGSLNQRLRTDPAFERAWVQSLTQIYRQAGLRPGEARAAAERKAAEAKTGELPAPAAAELPAASVDPALRGRIDRLEQAEIERGLNAVGDELDAGITTAIQRTAPGMEKLHGHIHRTVLHQLAAYSDPEILEMRASGQLNRLVYKLARDAQAATKAVFDEAIKAQATGASGAGKNAPPAPLKGGTPPAPAGKEFVARMGRGLKDMHERLRQEFEVPAPSE
jgi:hypothetical protein